MARLLKRPGPNGTATEVLLDRTSGASMPVRVSIRTLPDRDAKHLSLGVVVSDLTEFKKREELLRGFSHGVMQAQETERLQIATDLGDNIAQLLCSILVRCQLLAGRLPAYETDFRADTAEFAKLLRTTANEVHRISAELRPHGLEILGLVAALRGVAAEFAERMGVSIDTDSIQLATRLSAPAELALYRILQESLRNVERHARARHVTVTLSRRGSAIRLTVKDDGIGFDTSDQESNGLKKGQIGLLSMRERAITVGGSLSVNSRSSGGTEVRLTIPSSS
jgi:signal transduction histidine kinase